MFMWMRNPLITLTNPYDSWLTLNSKWWPSKPAEITLIGQWAQYWQYAAVTRTFHTLLTIYLRLGRTLPDSATRSPGLYSSILPTRPTLSPHKPTTQRSPIFLTNSVHHNVSDPNNKHLNSDKSRNHIKLRNTHIYI